MADKQSREVIGGKRRCGKTTELIRRAFIDQLYILCANRDMARHVAERAKEMDLNIPHPITIEDLPLETTYVNRILIDEAEMVLQSLIGRPVESMSTSMSMNELPSLHKGKERTSPKSSKSIGSLHVDIDCSDALKGLKAVQREARKATRSLKELEEQRRKDKCLVIELDEMGDVPRVYHNGVEVKAKKKVGFNWDTANDKLPSRTSLLVDYYVKDRHGMPTEKSIREIKGSRSNHCKGCNRHEQYCICEGDYNA